MARNTYKRGRNMGRKLVRRGASVVRRVGKAARNTVSKGARMLRLTKKNKTRKH